MEINVEQGDIIEFVENRMQVLVLSKNFFNKLLTRILHPLQSGDESYYC